jgi:cation transport regulator ChaC
LIEPAPLWIFGYGSLIWKPEIPFDLRLEGYIHGFQRRFYQGSTDHRGVPGAPGRVVTLLPQADAVCWGIAYRIPPERQAEVLQRLDHREKGGYDRIHTAFHAREAIVSKSIMVSLYHATPTNPNYLGPAPLKEMSRQIIQSVGPSGANTEYLLELAGALRRMNLEDRHVFALEERVRAALLTSRQTSDD